MNDWKLRWRAAAALADRDLKDVARELGVDQATLDRNIVKGQTRKQRRAAAALARDVADYCNLPFEFFTADFRLLEAEEAAAKIERVAVALGINPNGNGSKP